MEGTAIRQAMKEFVDHYGWDELLRYISNDYRYKELDIYKISMGWYDSDDYYTIKGRGTKGDLSIRLI